MASTAMTFRIQPGMTPATIEFAEEALGPRRAGHDASRAKLGITREKVWVENTNRGDTLVFYLEGGDLDASMSMLGESNSMYDLWFREKIYALTGSDWCDFRQVKPAELIFESPPRIADGNAAATAIVLHVLPGETDELRELMAALAGPRAEDYGDFLARHGLYRVRMYLQPREDAGTVIMYAEGRDPGTAIATFARSSEPFDAWFREELLKINGTDFIRRQTAPAPHLVLDWRAPVKGRQAA